jgi:hypothetical protein
MGASWTCWTGGTYSSRTTATNTTINEFNEKVIKTSLIEASTLEFVFEFFP